ncbi:hemerythrin domain-containing protein [Nannocystis pusilla]|uniref:hemerythrin domain-containing protein n=1 Tax=Nannocystis pusilla TaxID=889268 RepID=UPI003BF0BFCC
MRKQTISRDIAGVARRLHDEHVAFDQEFDDLSNFANAGAWGEVDAVWTGFTREIEDHFQFEQEQVFPGFARQSPECREMVDMLSAQHAKILQELESLGLQIQLHEIRAPTIERLVELMRKHAEVENTHIYPWLAREGRDEDEAVRKSA